MKAVWIDVETTGLDCKKDTIIELAAIYEDVMFHEFCLPSAKPKNWAEIEELTGITWDYLERHGVNESVLYCKFESWLCGIIDKFDKKDKAVFCGYGTYFDSSFIRELFSKNYNKFYGSFFFSLPMDVQSFVGEALIERAIPMLENYKLSTVCEHLDIDIKAHSGVSDIIATREVYLKLKLKLEENGFIHEKLARKVKNEKLKY